MSKFFPIYLMGIMLVSSAAKAQQPTNALDMSNYLTGIVINLSQNGQKWGNAHSSATQTKDYSKLAAIRLKLEKNIDSKQAELAKITDVEDSKDFRLAIMAFLDYQKKMIIEGFKPFEKLNSK